MFKINRRHNLRDLGGLPVGERHKVRCNRIFRSGSLYKLSNQDNLKLEREGLSLVIDLRTPQEILEKPDEIIPGVKYVKLPFLTDEMVGVTHQSSADPIKIVRSLRKDKQALMQMFPDMEAIYLKMVTDKEIQKRIGRALNLIIDTVLNGGIVLFHCTAGKDRTGVLAAIVLSLLGVSREDVLKDYIKTNHSAYFGAVKKGVVMGTLTHSLGIGLEGYQLFMAQQRHLIKTMSVIRKKYSTVDKFAIEECGCDPDKLQLFKQKMLVPYRPTQTEKLLESL